MAKVNALSRHSQIHLLLIATSLLLIIVPVLNKTPNQKITEMSVHAAAQFLFLVDTQEYSRSWDVTSDVLKNMLSQEAWNEQLEKLRTFLGPILQRMHHDISYTDTVSDVPDGKYVILTFISRFELREQVIETITLMLGDDDQWQVVGYFLR